MHTKRQGTGTTFRWENRETPVKLNKDGESESGKLMKKTSCKWKKVVNVIHLLQVLLFVFAYEPPYSPVM